MSEKEAYEMTYMLEGVMTFGTGTAASISHTAAGKTGTTDDNKDAWFVGYTPDIVTAVWIGDDSGSHSLGEVYGGTIPAEIWHDYMSVATEDETHSDFDVPSGMDKLKAAPKEEKSTAKTTSKSNSTATDKNSTTQQKSTTSQQTKQPASRSNKE
jgi:penicillin-binding protein 1A